MQETFRRLAKRRKTERSTMSGLVYSILGAWLINIPTYGGGSTTRQTTRPSLFVVLLLKSLLSSSETVYCSCECAYLLRRLFIISYTSTNSLLLCDQNSWFVTIQPASPILSEPAFKETISTVKEGEETDKSESASSVLEVCDNVIINSLIAFLSGPTSSSDHNCIVVT